MPIGQPFATLLTWGFVPTQVQQLRCLNMLSMLEGKGVRVAGGSLGGLHPLGAPLVLLPLVGDPQGPSPCMSVDNLECTTNTE